MARFTTLLRRCAAAALAAALATISMTHAARADLQACYDLAKIDPAILKVAASFVAHHGECVAYFDDPVFVSITGSLTVNGVSSGACTSLMSNADSPAGKAVMSVAPVAVVAGYLDCSCAAATSGIAAILKKIVANMKSCAATFDPSGAIFSGLDLAGSTVGLSTLWGLESNAPNPNAGVGNGGAPTFLPLELPTCKLDESLTGKVFELGGPYAASCFCPPPTQVFSGGIYQQQAGNVVTIGPGYTVGGLPNGNQNFVCRAPCPEGLYWTNGTCTVCPNSNPYGWRKPDMSHLGCEGGGMSPPSCPKNMVRSTTYGACHLPCTGGQNWSEQANACVSPTSGFCDGGQIVNGVCHHCTFGTSDPACNSPHTCLAGQHWNTVTNQCQANRGGDMIAPVPACALNQKWNGAACVTLSACPADQQWNLVTKQCQANAGIRMIAPAPAPTAAPACPRGQKWNGAACVSNRVRPNRNQ